MVPTRRTTLSASRRCSLLRRAYAFTASNPLILPLYVEAPRQAPFTNENQQTENRFIITAHIEANQTVTLPQAFADQLVLDLQIEL